MELPRRNKLMARITGELDLSRISKDDFSKDLGLRVAVVREGKILGSTDLKPPADSAKRISFSVDYNPVFNPGVRWPCGVIILVGPQVSDQEFLAVDTLRYVVDFASAIHSATKKGVGAAVAAEAAETNIGVLAVTPELYLCWIYCCPEHTIRGRLVCRQWSYDRAIQRWLFCDSPVPGATVYIYDVRCFFWWCWRRLIGTATTDVFGNFTFKFRWCCFRWLPWLDPVWLFNQDLYRRISELFTLAKPPVPPGPGPDPSIFQALLAKATSSRNSSRALPSNVSAASAASNSLSREALLSVLPASAELEALHVWPWWPWDDCGPNIVFEATQICKDRREVVYWESNANARWDIGTSTSVTLVANDNACCLPACHEPSCPDCLVFTHVCGELGIAAGDISSDTSVPALPLLSYADTASKGDLAFTQDLFINGDLGAGIDYYKVQYKYSNDVGVTWTSWTDLPVPAFEGFTIGYWDPGLLTTVYPPSAFFPVLKDGHTVIISRDHYASVHSVPTSGGAVLWTDYDTLFRFDTLATGINDGLYELQLVGYTADTTDTHLTNERVVPLCGTENPATLYLQVDNRHSIHPAPTPTHPYNNNPPLCPSAYSSNHICTLEPECYFRQICQNEGQPGAVCFGACDIITLKDTDTLTIHFTVSCPNNVDDAHLGGYTLEAIYGYSDVLTIGTAAASAPPCPSTVLDPVGMFEADPPLASVQVGPTYADAITQGATRPLWTGGDYKVTLNGCDFPESCSYLFQLCAWKRTTNGCTTSACQNLDYNIFDLTLTIIKA